MYPAYRVLSVGRAAGVHHRSEWVKAADAALRPADLKRVYIQHIGGAGDVVRRDVGQVVGQPGVLQQEGDDIVLVVQTVLRQLPLLSVRLHCLDHGPAVGLEGAAETNPQRRDALVHRVLNRHVLLHLLPVLPSEGGRADPGGGEHLALGPVDLLLLAGGAAHRPARYQFSELPAEQNILATL